MTGRGDKRRGRHSPSPSETSDDDAFTHIQCWIPATNIDLVVLAAYLKDFIDDTATIKTAASPSVNPSKPGYQVGARNTLSVPAVQDIIQDLRAWEKEKTNREFRKEPYPYNESDTWYSRKKKGASPGATKPRQRRRRPTDKTADTAATTSDTTRASRPQQAQAAGRHSDPRPESPPRPSNPPPDILKEREGESKIPKPGIESQFKKMSIAGDKDNSRDNLTKKQTYEESREEANRTARVQPNTSSARHRDKMEDDMRSTTTSGRRERANIDDDDVRSTTSGGRIRDRHAR